MDITILGLFIDKVEYAIQTNQPNFEDTLLNLAYKLRYRIDFYEAYRYINESAVLIDSNFQEYGVRFIQYLKQYEEFPGADISANVMAEVFKEWNGSLNKNYCILLLILNDNLVQIGNECHYIQDSISDQAIYKVYLTRELRNKKPNIKIIHEYLLLASVVNTPEYMDDLVDYVILKYPDSIIYCYKSDDVKTRIIEKFLGIEWSDAPRDIVKMNELDKRSPAAKFVTAKYLRNIIEPNKDYILKHSRSVVSVVYFTRLMKYARKNFGVE